MHESPRLQRRLQSLDAEAAVHRVRQPPRGEVPQPVRPRAGPRLPWVDTEAEKPVIATGCLLPLQLARHGLTADQVQVNDDAVEAVIGGYTREAGVWDLAGALGALCAKAPPCRGARARGTRERRATKRTKRTKGRRRTRRTR